MCAFTTLFSLEKRWQGGTSSKPTTLKVNTERSEALSSQGITWTKQEATGTSCTRRSFISTEERHFYSSSLEQHAQECDKVALTESFQDAIGQGAK